MKGKARAIGPYPGTTLPAHVAPGSTSKAPAVPLGSPVNAVRVKREQADHPLIKTQRTEPTLTRPRRGSSPEEPPLGVTQRGPPTRAKTEKREPIFIKSERTEPILPRGRHAPVKATPGSLARPPSSSAPRSLASSTIRVQTISVKSSPSPSPFSSGHCLVPSSSSSPPTGLPEIIDVDALDDDGPPAAKPTALKRRLGMGRGTGGYANKKFKPLQPSGP